jgi:hypothetical protein
LLHRINKSSSISANIATPILAIGDLMKDSTRVALVFISSCFFTSASFGQSTSAVAQQSTPSSTPTSTCGVTFGPLLAVPVPGSAPYSAEQESTNIQTLADGTHITRKPFTQKLYRDAQGRTRTERSFCQGPNETSIGLVIEIRDPVVGYSYVLDEQNHVAHRFALPAKHPVATSTSAASLPSSEAVQKTANANPDPTKPIITRESLGSQTMEGILVEGTRTTEIIPEGSQGNDRPITVVREHWTSPELRISILIKDNDPRRGESETRLTNIDVSNPILALFQPPADYNIVDETDHVTLTFTRN